MSTRRALVSLVVGVALIIVGAWLWANSYVLGDIEGVILWLPFKGFIGFLIVLGGVFLILYGIMTYFQSRAPPVEAEESPIGNDSAS